MELISKRIFEKYSKMKILFFDIFEKGQILRPFSGLAHSKLKIFSTNLMVACAYSVFYLPISEESNGWGYRKKGGPKRVKYQGRKFAGKIVVILLGRNLPISGLERFKGFYAE